MYLTLLFSAFSFSAEPFCPDWIRRGEAPVCPPGATMVTENFPKMGLVVSDDDVGGVGGGKFALAFVEKALLASGDRPPLMLLPVAPATFKKIQVRVKEIAGTDPKRAEWLKALRFVPAKSYTWQQDYFESFVGADGKPVIREVNKYIENLESGPHGPLYQPDSAHLRLQAVKNIAKAAGACGAIQGEKIRQDAPLGENGNAVDAYSGGNMEALPGGVCLLGTGDLPSHEAWAKLAKEVCGRNPAVKINTSWLFVGHVDEILKVVPDKTAAAPCDFALTVASPKKAVELLRRKPAESFLLPPAYEGLSSLEAEKAMMSGSLGFKELCSAIREMRKKNRLSPGEEQNESPGRKQKQNSGSAAWLERIERFFAAGEAWAAEGRKILIDKTCPGLKNADVVALWENPHSQLRRYNELVQKELDEAKYQMVRAMAEKYPQCKPKVLELPDLFWSDSPVYEGPNGPMMPQGLGKSLLPNPSNSLLVNETLIMPEPGNAAFRAELQSMHEKLGLKTDFIDTYDYLHVRRGNLHCATHALPFCRPGGAP